MAVSTTSQPECVRITSDGTMNGTRIYDAESGVDISNQIRSVAWTHRAGHAPELIITLTMALVDVTSLVDSWEVSMIARPEREGVDGR